MIIACLRLIKPALCNDFGLATNNDSVFFCMFSLHVEDSSNIQTISGMLRQFMDPKGKYLEITDMLMDFKR